MTIHCSVLQIAKAQGAFVATTCSGRNADFVKGLGADRAIDYTQERWGCWPCWPEGVHM
jgi:NADPH:quinone reductase-like Zn-dependent oxidoreductase